MATNAKDLIRSAAFHSIRACYRSVRDHPLVAGALLSLLLLYTCFPTLFFFLLSSSPVIAITTLLLGLLLSHGHHPNLPHDTHPTTVSASIAPTPADDLVVTDSPGDGETRVVEAHAESSSDEDDVEEEEREFSPFSEGLKVKIDNKQENFLDSSLGSPWQPVDFDGDAASSGSDSDRAESSSPDASMADIVPMLDELHPLLDDEEEGDAAQPVLRSVDSWNEHAASGESSRGSEDGDREEHQDDDRGDATAVKWTADDQRNVMDLGISDMERNRRLENLIARRRARRRDLRFVTERNLIDLDSASGGDELSRFQVRIPPISATRRNPFDLPYGSEGMDGLPPIPGSAPSALSRRQNPFDLPFDRVGLGGSLTTDNLVPEDLISREDMFLGLHEDFSWGATFSDGIGQERSKELFTEESDLKMSSIPESGMVPLIVGREQHVDVLEREFHQESELLSAHDTYPVGQESSISLGAALVDTGISAGEFKGIDLNASVAAEAVRLVDDAYGAVGEEIKEDGVNLTVTDAAKLEVEDELESSLEGHDKRFESTREEPVSLDATKDDSSKDCSDTVQSHTVDCSSPSRLEAGVDEVKVADPVYDLSPSGSTVSVLDEALIDAGRGGGLISPLPSHIQEVVSASTSNILEKDVLSDTASEPVKVTSPNLFSIDKNGYKSAETTEIGEHGIIQDQLSIDRGNSYQPIPHVVPMVEAVMQSSGLSPIETESSALIDTSITSEEDEKIGSLNLVSHAYVSSDNLMTAESQIAYKAIEEPEMHPSQEARFDESRIRFPNLASIPEENVDDFKLNEENEGRTDTPRVIGVTGQQIIEEPIIEFSDIDKERSLFHAMSTEGTVDAENTSRQIHEIVSPVVSVTDLAGESLLETTKSMEYTGQLDTDFEHESHSSPNDLQGLIINRIQGDQEGEFPDMLINLDDKPNEIHAEVRTVEEIKEELLSELDVIGDFHAELKSDHGDHQEKMQYERLNDSISNPLIYDEEQEIVTQLQFPEARSTGVNLTSSDEFRGLIDQLEVTEQVESSSQSYHIDPEMTVYNPQLHVLEACSLEELDTAFKKLREEAVMSSGSEQILEQPLAAKTELGSDVLDVNDPNLTESDSKMHILEASSLEELQSVFKQLHEEALLTSGSEPISERSLMAETEVGLATAVGDPKVIKTDSELQDLEASSFEELDSVFKQLHGGAVPPDSKLNVDVSETAETEAGSNELETANGEQKKSDKNFELQDLESKSSEGVNLAFNELTERDSEKSAIPEVEPSQEIVHDKNLVSMGVDSDLQVVEAKSLEDIQLALKQLTDGSADLPVNLMEPEVSSVAAEATERHLEPEVLVGQSEEKMHLDSAEDVSREPRSGNGQSDEKSTGVVKVADVPSSDASSSRTTRKEDKSGKSSSSSSSSSSDSD